MSNSYRHTPIFGIAGGAPKRYKVGRHRQERARFRNALARAVRTGDYDNLDIRFAPHDMWDDPRDGKYYSPNFYPRCGWGVHNREVRPRHFEWTKEGMDEAWTKAMRK